MPGKKDTRPTSQHGLRHSMKERDGLCSRKPRKRRLRNSHRRRFTFRAAPSEPSARNDSGSPRSSGDGLRTRITKGISRRSMLLSYSLYTKSLMKSGTPVDDEWSSLASKEDPFEEEDKLRKSFGSLASMPFQEERMVLKRRNP